MNTPSRPRGRPRRFDRTQALELAMELFWKHGYADTSVHELTLALGIAPPSLYAAFGSKEQLYIEALEHYLATHGERMLAALHGAPDARSGVRALLEAAVDTFIAGDEPRGCLVASGMLRCAKSERPLAQHTAQVRRRGQDAILARLQGAQAAGDLAGADLLALSAFYAAMIQGLSMQAIDGATRDELMAIVTLAMRAWPAN